MALLNHFVCLFFLLVCCCYFAADGDSFVCVCVWNNMTRDDRHHSNGPKYKHDSNKNILKSNQQLTHNYDVKRNILWRWDDCVLLYFCLTF